MKAAFPRGNSGMEWNGKLEAVRFPRSDGLFLLIEGPHDGDDDLEQSTSFKSVAWDLSRTGGFLFCILAGRG
jgi:hypothetical protein